MSSIKIGRTSFNLDALKGMSKSAFLKGGLGHTLETWEALQEHLPQVVIKKKNKKEDKPSIEVTVEEKKSED